MAKYIHFTEEQKRTAASVDLEYFLRSRGETLIPSGLEKRLTSDHSITVRGCEWYDHAEARGGHAVSFVQRFYGLSYPEAVSLLLGSELDTPYPLAKDPVQDDRKPFMLPPPCRDMRRAFAYLVKHRKIDHEIVSAFAKSGLLYEDAQYHNVVFVGTDKSGIPRHAHKRSTNATGKSFRMNVEGSDPRYSFHHIGTDGSLYVFEAPIDLMSYITLHPEHWREHSYVACCGTSSLPVLEMLAQLPNINTVHLCLDNDKAGQAACRRMEELLAEKNVRTVRLIPDRKDWNEELLTLESEVHAPCLAPGF